MACRYSSARTRASGERQGGSRITKEKAGLKSYSQEFSRVKNCRTLFFISSARRRRSLRSLSGWPPRYYLVAGTATHWWWPASHCRRSVPNLSPLSRHSRATLVLPTSLWRERRRLYACHSLKKLVLKSGAKIISKPLLVFLYKWFFSFFFALSYSHLITWSRYAIVIGVKNPVCILHAPFSDVHDANEMRTMEDATQSVR